MRAPRDNYVTWLPAIRPLSMARRGKSHDSPPFMQGAVARWRRRLVDALEDRRHSLPHPDAEGSRGITRVCVPELVQDRAGEPRARHP